MTCLYCIVALTQSWRSTACLEGHPAHRKDRLFSACYTASQAGAGSSHYWRNSWPKSTAQGSQLEIIAWTIRWILAACPEFACIDAPLNKNLKNGEPRRFESLDQEKHDLLPTLQDELASSPVLALPRNIGHLTLDTGACDKQISCLDARATDRTNRPLSHWSKTLNVKDQSYGTAHPERLALVWALRYYTHISRVIDLPFVWILMRLYGSLIWWIPRVLWRVADFVY